MCRLALAMSAFGNAEMGLNGRHWAQSCRSSARETEWIRVKRRPIAGERVEGCCAILAAGGQRFLAWPSGFEQLCTARMLHHLRRICRRFSNSPWAAGSAKFIVLMICLLPFRGETTCSDGTHSSSIGRRGACSHHGGVGMRSGTIPLVLSVAGGLVVGIRRAAQRHRRTFELPTTWTKRSMQPTGP